MTGRIVPLTEELLRWAAIEAPDPATAEFTRDTNWEAQYVTPPAIGEALLDGGRVMAVGGLLPLWPGRGLAWLMLSPHAAPAHKVRAMRQIRRRLFEAQAGPAWRRVEMYVRQSEPWADRLARYLDMRLEGTMAAFDPLGRDHKLFARVAPVSEGTV